MYTPPGMDFQADPLAVALSQWKTPPNNQGMPYYGTPNFTGGPVGGGEQPQQQQQAPAPPPAQASMPDRFSAPVSTPPVTVAPPMDATPSAISTPLGGSRMPAVARPMLGPGASLPNSRPFGFGSMFGGRMNGQQGIS